MKESSAILDMLLQHRIITRQQQLVAEYEQYLNDSCALRWLMCQGLLCGTKWQRFACALWQLECVDLEACAGDEQLLSECDPAQLKEDLLLPLRVRDSVVEVAICEPYNVAATQRLQEVLQFRWTLQLQLADYWAMMKWFDRATTAQADVGRTLARISRNPQLLKTVRSEDAHPVAQLVNQTLGSAIQQQASDVHFDPWIGAVHVRFRRDGVLVSRFLLHTHLWKALCIRIKVLAHLDISEYRRPQEGGFRQSVHPPVDVRVSIMPGLYGEHVVLRLLNTASNYRLEQLRLPRQQLHHLQKMIRQPGGLAAVAGPTGSGKSTTLYALLRTLDTRALNVVTLEDPVEQRIEGVRQIEIQPHIGFDFPTALRAVLRQDPDVIFIGEIRDPETATLALQASMTGHLVLSTIHADDIEGIVLRLQELGIPPAAMLRHSCGFISQRLLRKVCASCAGSGCRQCGEQGYAGRFVIMESLIPKDSGTGTLNIDASVKRLRQVAREAVDERLTTEAEVMRVLGDAV